MGWRERTTSGSPTATRAVRLVQDAVEPRPPRFCSCARHLSRDPKADELAPRTDHAQLEDLENTCRVILNLNEFTFVD